MCDLVVGDTDNQPEYDVASARFCIQRPLRWLGKGTYEKPIMRRLRRPVLSAA